MFKKTFLKLNTIFRKRNILRKISQLLNISLFFFFLYKSSGYPLSEKLPLNFYFKLDGLLAISTAMINGEWFQYFLSAFLLISLIFFVGNFFCFWVCPLGGCIDYINIIVGRRPKRFGLPSLEKVKKAGLWVLFLVFVSAFLCRLFDGVAFVGFVFDPFVILGMALTGAKLWVFFLVFILLISTFFHRFWCNYFCPLGRLYTIIGTIKKRLINKKLYE